MGYLAVRATEQGWDRVAEIVLRERTAELMLRSATLAVTVTTACVVIGVAMAWLIVRSDLPGRRVWGVLAALPLAVPTYVAAYAWISTAPRLAGFRGAALVLIVCSYPYVYLPVAAALRGLDPALEEASASLGTHPLVTFLRVTLPQLKPAIGAGALLVALYVLSDFGAVSIMRHDVITRVIYMSYRASFDRTPAAVLGCLLVAVTVVLVWLEARTRERARYAPVGSGARRHVAATRLGPWTLPAFAAMTALSGLALGLPFASLGYWLTRGRSAGFAVADIGRAASSSLWVSALGALVTTALAIPVGVLAARHRSRVASAIERSSYAGHALPGVVVALAMVFISVRYAFPLYQRTPTLVAAYAVLFLPLAVGAVRASVAQAQPVLEEVARSLGHHQLDVLRRVTLPLAAPGIAAGAALVFLTCIKELPATLLLHPTGMDTLATELWSETTVGAYAAAAPYAALLVLVAAVPTYVLGRRTGALEGGGEQ
jgi:iron(III) transport system permease protein